MNDVHVIQELEERKGLADPLCFLIVKLLMPDPMSTAELARALGVVGAGVPTLLGASDSGGSNGGNADESDPEVWMHPTPFSDPLTELGGQSRDVGVGSRTRDRR